MCEYSNRMPNIPPSNPRFSNKTSNKTSHGEYQSSFGDTEITEEL